MERKRRTRRRHSAEFKAEVVKACCAPGVSIAGVALSYGLNANLVRRWVEEHGVTPASRRAGAAKMLPLPIGEFVPVTVEAAHPAEPIRIELRRGATTVSVQWPRLAAGDCAVWLRDWLR